MAEISDGGGSRRGVNTELNLVPFVDLMSVLITFLLVTAVWTQISMMQIGSSIYGKRLEDDKPPEITPNADVLLRLDVLEQGYRVIFKKDRYFVEKVDGEYDTERVKDFLIGVKQQYPDKKDAVVSMQDELAYEHLIAAMDLMLQAEFPLLSVSTGGPN